MTAREESVEPQTWGRSHEVAVLAALELIPGVGGTLATVVEEVFDRRRARVHDLATGVLAQVAPADLIDRLRADPRFGDLFVLALERVARADWEPKRAAMGRVVVEALSTTAGWRWTKANGCSWHCTNLKPGTSPSSHSSMRRLIACRSVRGSGSQRSLDWKPLSGRSIGTAQSSRLLITACSTVPHLRLNDSWPSCRWPLSPGTRLVVGASVGRRSTSSLPLTTPPACDTRPGARDRRVCSAAGSASC